MHEADPWQPEEGNESQRIAFIQQAHFGARPGLLRRAVWGTSWRDMVTNLLHSERPHYYAEDLLVHGDCTLQQGKEGY